MWMWIDMITLAGGIAMIVVPDKVYNWGRRGESKEPPKNWPIKSRIIGVIFVALSAVFLYMEYTNGMGA